MNLSSAFIWRSGPRRRALQKDMRAGLSVWAVLIPEALAIALIAGVPPVVGLYAIPAALVLYALAGPSRLLIVGPVSTTAILSAAIVAGRAPTSASDFVALTAGLAILTGVLALAAAALRLGFVAAFVPVAVLKGFVVGLALTIIALQVPALVGVARDGDTFVDQAWNLVGALDEVSGWTMLLGFASLTLIYELRERLPWAPAALLVAVLGTLVVWIGGLDQHGVATVGVVDSAIPAPAWPGALDLDAARGLLPGALAILLIAFVETQAAARTAGTNTGSNRELAGLGAANLGAGFFGGIAVHGDASRTQLNIDSGARSKGAALTVAGLTLLLLLAAGLLEFLPLAVLAAVAIAIAVRLIDLPYFERLYALARAEGGVSGLASAQTLQDFTAAMCAAVGVLALGVMPGFVVALVASIVLLMLRSSRPRISVEFGSHGNGAEHAEVAPACVVLRPEASPFFANAESMRAAIERFDEEYDAGVVVLDLERTPYVDVAGAELIVELVASFEARGKRLLVVRGMGPARRLLLATAASHDAYIDVFGSVDAALNFVSGATLDERLRRRRPA